MARALPADHPLVQATASLLSDDPDLTNAHLLRKLPRLVGASVVREVPVTHFQRRVRDPAERLLRQRVMGVAPPPPRSNGQAPRSSAPAPEDAPQARSQATPRRSPRGLSRARKSAVDEALLVAFELGAGTDSPADVVEAYRHLETLRDKLRSYLDAGTTEKPKLR